MTILVATRNLAGMCVATGVPVATGNPRTTVVTGAPPKVGGVQRTHGEGENAARRNRIEGAGRKERTRFVLIYKYLFKGIGGSTLIFTS